MAAGDDYALLACALSSFVSEHGLPNAVAPTELHRHYHAPSPLKIGRLVRLDWVRASLVREHGIIIADVASKSPETGLTQIKLEQV